MYVSWMMKVLSIRMNLLSSNQTNDDECVRFFKIRRNDKIMLMIMTIYTFPLNIYRPAG